MIISTSRFWSNYRTFCLVYYVLIIVTSCSKPVRSSATLDVGGGSAEATLDNDHDQTCTWENRDSCKEGFRDPHLKPMTFRFMDEDEVTFLAYVDPDIALAYNATPGGSVTPKETTFNGQFAKFINLSQNRIHVYWEVSKGGERSYISDISPFSSGGTASYPSHRFVVVDPTTNKDLITWVVVKGNSLYSYDPFGGSIEEASKSFNAAELELYKLQLRNLAFNEQYQQFTGRQWLALYGRKHAPRYPMWPADFMGQMHTVTTSETHLVELPPANIAKAKVSKFGATVAQREKLVPYRTPNQDTLTLNLTVVSVIPRVIEIQNFLSAAEVDHIMDLATGMTLGLSSTGSNSESTTNGSTRTSRNSWIAREHSLIIDSLHRRAADLLQIDEAYMRHRNKDEMHLLPEQNGPISERLQLVHYDVGQQYTPHHDFMMPVTHDPYQATRFATILLYLNDEGLKGGETSFPRWLNGATRQVLEAKPQVGKAVLFYNQLPDGNYDERSQHAAKPVIEGEKWLVRAIKRGIVIVFSM